MLLSLLFSLSLSALSISGSRSLRAMISARDDFKRLLTFRQFFRLRGIAWVSRSTPREGSAAAIAEFGAKHLRKGKCKKKEKRAARPYTREGPTVADCNRHFRRPEAILASETCNERKHKTKREGNKPKEKKKKERKPAEKEINEERRVRQALAQRIRIPEPIIFLCQLNDSCPVHSA